MRRKWPLLLALAGCEEPLRLRVLDAWDNRPVLRCRGYLEEGCAIIGHECVLTDRAYGAITLKLIDSAPGQSQGCSYSREDMHGCRRAGWVGRDGTLVAHELAHLLGFPGDEFHAQDPQNVLNVQGQGTELTEHQQRVIDRHVRRVGACR